MISHDADDLLQGLWPSCERCIDLAEELGRPSTHGLIELYDDYVCGEGCLAARAMMDAEDMMAPYSGRHEI